MNIGNSIRKAIDDWEQCELESAMLHACNAVDGTAKKLYPSFGSNARFTLFLRENYEIFGPMGVPGINLVDTRFPVIVPRPKAPGGKPDVADIIYGIHRCSHGHGEDLPEGFDLIRDTTGPKRLTRMEVKRGKVRLSDRIIFGLLAVVILSPINKELSIPEGYYLTYGESPKLNINEWWGRANDFKSIIAQDPTPLVTLDFSNWES